jgi:RNA polymerase sigma-70 factor (ECF subfamily)
MIQLNDPVEQQWLAALAAGDEAALRSIFDRYYTVLLGDVDRIIPDESTAKDIVQEVFVELWRKRADIDVHTSLRAYLRRAAINRSLNFLKSKQRFLFSEHEDGHMAEQDPIVVALHDAAAQPENMESALHEAIRLLPEKCRLVFTLSKFEQMSHREIAEQLGISVKTIENQITKAMKMLRSYMLEYRNLSQVVIWGLYWWYKS